MIVKPGVLEDENKIYHCSRCGRDKKGKNFYVKRNGERSEMCKDCQTAHIDPFVPETFLWLFREDWYDLPYIPSEWNAVRDKVFARSNKKANGKTVFGKYLAKMRLNHWADYRWKDTEWLTKEDEERQVRAVEERKEKKEKELSDLKDMYERGAISEAEYRTMVDTSTQYYEQQERDMELMKIAAQAARDKALKQQQQMRGNVGGGPQITDTPYMEKPFNSPSTFRSENPTFYNEMTFPSADEMPDLAAELTKEDREYLMLKWGRLYTPAEWIDLEKKYHDMKESFVIEDSDSESSLLLICKTYLKMMQALDSGDMETYKKLALVYNDLRKTSKFTAAQKVEEKEEEVDDGLELTSFGELVAYCEKVGGAIPRYQIDCPRDIADVVLTNMNEYTESLFRGDPGIAEALDAYLHKLEMAQQKDDEEDDNEEEAQTNESIEAYYNNLAAEAEEEAEEEEDE